MTTVLHLTDCGGGGVPVVIDTILGAIAGEVAFIGTAPHGFVHRASIALETGGSRTKNPLRIRRNLDCLVAGLRDRRIDLIHAHSSFGGVYGALLARRLGVPLVYSPHASPAMIPGKSFGERLIARLEGLSCHTARRVIACSDDEAQALRGLCPAERIVVVPNGVRVDTPVEVAGDWDLLAVGRISAQKRPDLFVQLVEALRRQRPEVRVAWLGPGEPPAGAGAGAGAIEWMGEVPEAEVARLLSRTRVFVSTSDYEGLSLAALKAACAGCHLFLRDTIGNRAPVLLGAEGTCFGDVGAGATALAGLLADPAAHTAAARTTRAERARAIFSLDTQMARLREIYADCTAGGAAR